MMHKLVSSGGLLTLLLAVMLGSLLYYPCFLARLCQLKTLVCNSQQCCSAIAY